MPIYYLETFSLSWDSNCWNLEIINSHIKNPNLKNYFDQRNCSLHENSHKDPENYNYCNQFSVQFRERTINYHYKYDWKYCFHVNEWFLDLQSHGLQSHSTLKSFNFGHIAFIVSSSIVGSVTQVN